MTASTPTLAHLAEALRAHRLRVGAGQVPAALIGLEAELLAALSGTLRPTPDVGPSIGQRDRVSQERIEGTIQLVISPVEVHQ